MTTATPAAPAATPAQTYATAILSFAAVLITGLVALPDMTASSGIQYLILVLGAVAAYAFKILPAGVRWRGLVKTGAVIIAAALTVAAPFIIGGHWSVQNIAVVALAGVQALATELGVKIRIAGEDAAAAPTGAVVNLSVHRRAAPSVASDGKDA